MSALFLDVTFSLLKTLDWIIIIRLATQYIKYADSARLKPILSLSSSSFVRRIGFWYIRWKIIKLLWKLVCVKKTLWSLLYCGFLPNWECSIKMRATYVAPILPWGMKEEEGKTAALILMKRSQFDWTLL